MVSSEKSSHLDYINQTSKVRCELFPSYQNIEPKQILVKRIRRTGQALNERKEGIRLKNYMSSRKPIFNRNLNEAHRLGAELPLVGPNDPLP
jgi:hypothetical protein